MGLGTAEADDGREHRLNAACLGLLCAELAASF
jgi:hypothetical protein